MVCILLCIAISSLVERIMIKNRLLGIGLTVLIIIFIFIQPAYIGPGSNIAKTVWGLLFFIGLTLTCLPLGIYQFVCGKRDEQRLLKDPR